MLSIAIHSLWFGNVQLSTGVRLHYAEAGTPAEEPLVLLHGITDSWFSWSRVLPALAERHHVYALDQRGHGDSDRPAAGYAMADYAADVLAFLDAIDRPRATLVGHSMGTLVAQQVALTAPERVARLALVGAAASGRNQGLIELQAVVNTLEDPVPAEFVHEFQASTAYQPLPDEFMARVVTESRKLPASVWRAGFDGLLAADLTARLGEIRCPTLILWGEHDAVFGRADVEPLAAGVRGAELKVYPETGHTPHWEHPQRVVRDLMAFVSQS